MKRSSKNSVIKLLTKFDQQLHDLLIKDLQTVRSKVKIIRNHTFNQIPEQLLTA